NGVAERRNRTLIEAARTMLADSKLPTTFWAKAVSTACYIQNRVLIVKPHNKTPYELFRGLKPAISFMKLFGCHVTILNTLDHLGKFDGKSDEGYFVGYSLSSKAFRVYNTRTRKVEENFHVGFLENKPMIEGTGPKWLFDIDSLTQTMNYAPVTGGTSTNDTASTQGYLNAGTFTGLDETSQDCIIMPIWKDTTYFDSTLKDVSIHDPKSVSPDQEHGDDGPNDEHNDQDKSIPNSIPKEVNIVDSQVNTASPGVDNGSSKLNTAESPLNTAVSKDKSRVVPSSQDTNLEYFNDDDEPEVVLGNIPNSYAVLTTPHTRIQKDHPIDLPKGKRPIGVKWIIKNKTDERGIVIRNKARIKAIRLFLAYASFMGFMVYQMDVKSAFLYGTIEEEVYVCQPPGFEDPDFPDKVYKVVKALYGLHQALRAWYETLANNLLDNGFQRGKIDPTLFIKRKKGDILLVQVYVDDIIFGSTKKVMCDEFEKPIKDNQDKCVIEILRKFNYTDVKPASTTIDLEKPFTKDGDAEDVDVHLYRSMIGSLMYLTTSRPYIMFAVCACARFQVTPKTSHLTAVKRIFRYLKGKPTLGLWYSRDSPFELVAYTDSDYAGATQDRKSTSGGCQFLGSSLDFCDKHNMVAFLEKSVRDFIRTAEASTSTDGEVTITATIDGHSKTIIEESLRRHLKLEDHDGIESLPNSEIFEQLALMGYHTNSDRLTFQKGTFSPQWRPSPSQTQPTQPLPEAEAHVSTPHDSPLHSVPTHGSDEGSMQLFELTNLVTKLSDRIEILETDLQKTKKTYSTALTKLILKVKKLEKQVQKGKARRRSRIVLSEDDDDDIDMKEVHHKQSDDTEVVIVKGKPTEVIEDQCTATKAHMISTVNVNISIASTIRSEIRSTAGRVVYSRRSEQIRKDKGKAIMTEPEPKKKSKK
ncbi:putative ribonuclease H-like domain-containing protein, partial [Tanacetum coccineum]